MKTIFLLALSILPLTAAAETTPATDPAVICGGNYHGEELNFKLNPFNQILSARNSSEEFIAFLDLTQAKKLRVIFGETVKDAEWEKLKAVRDASSDKEFQDLVSRLGSTKTLDMWVGWTSDGYVHFEGSQREMKFSLSCQKKQ